MHRFLFQVVTSLRKQAANKTVKHTNRRNFAWSNRNSQPPSTERVVIYRTGRDGYQRFSYGDSHHHSYNRYFTDQQIFLIATFGTGGTFIWFMSRQEVPYTGRMHAILIDNETERQLGIQTFQQVILDAKMRRTLLPQTHPATKAVKRVGTRIAKVASDGAGGGYQSHMKGLLWEFVVINSPEVNAFVVPGGKVVVYTGLLRMLRNEDELAAVIAHEAGHVVSRHVAERLTQGSILELIRFFVYYVLGIPIPSGALSAIFFLPNSRKAETEADVIGVQLAARACYNPAAAAEVFAKLGAEEEKNGGNAIPKMLRTHPVSSDRIKKIKEMLPKAVELKEAAGCNGPMLREFVSKLDF